jgi:hypothetical protein
MEHRGADLIASVAAVGRAPFLRSLDQVAVPGKLGHPPYSGQPETPPNGSTGNVLGPRRASAGGRFSQGGRAVLIRLTDPIEIEGATIRAIQLRTPSAAGLSAIRAARDPIARRIAAVLACTGLPAEVLDEMDTGDFAEISDAAIACAARSRRA